ncbi:type I restriction-modification system subunit M [Pontiellaceae bacterium B12227]|nr:type I restriction-modification system subunit M [Pontiellaceae bacterium B12227]
MAIKKSELYSSLWKSCDELRGGMDASQYKDYVLTFLFVKYVSDKAAGDPNALIDVPEGGSYADMVALKGDKEIGDKINKIIGKLAEENDLKGVIDVADFNDEEKLGKGKDMVDRLSKLVAIFDGMDLSANRAEGDDLLGDAYEYLMRHFATESGKSKGQFYTPSEVSRILAKVVGITKDTPQDMTIYDPTCGSGSLLLKACDEAPRGLSICGQENDVATAALARMNMILHDNASAEIWKDNTLSSPYWKDKAGNLQTFDFSVANPPFSYKSWSNGVDVNNDPFGRFEYGTPPDKNGDYAFLLHILKSLKSTGKGAVILPHGVLFRGNAEASIRRSLIRQGYIKGIIGLPANLFYGTGIPACIIVLDKENAHSRKGIFMVDASKGFIKDGNKNRLRHQDIHKIVDTFTKQLEQDGFARMVSFAEIEKNDFNLNIPRYIDSSDPEDLHDLTAHLNGGIPNSDIDALGAYWKVFPTLRNDLFSSSARKGYSDCKVATAQVKSTILNHPEFTAFAERSGKLSNAWKKAHEGQLKGLSVGNNVKALIHELSESLLTGFAKADLVSRYDVYQLLMDYWDETMQDDVYVVTQDGWKAGNVLRELVAKKGEKLKETPDLVIGKQKYKSDLIPPSLIVARYFSEEQAEVDRLQAEKDSAVQTLEAFIEEHSGEEGLIEDAKNDKGKITGASLKARIKEIKGDAQAKDELAVLKQCQKLIDADSAAGKAVKAAQAKLDEAVFAKYPKLNEDEIKTLTVDDKWLFTILSAIQAEIERVTQQLATRIQTLETRYADPLPTLSESMAKLSGQVDAHLKIMGLSW